MEPGTAARGELIQLTTEEQALIAEQGALIAELVRADHDVGGGSGSSRQPSVIQG